MKPVAILFFFLSLSSSVFAAKEVKELQIGVKYKPESCEIKARKGDTVRVHYRGKLTDGTVFDSSFERGDPISFELGTGQYKPESCEIKARKGDTVRVHYRGKLTDGTVFDSSFERGDPISFELGTGQVIKGWDQGLLGTCVGEKRKLKIPAKLGYGEQGSPPTIPGMFKKKRKPDDINNQGRWQTPPFDIMENVVQRLNISDRIRLCIVCKSWSSIAMQRDIHSGPQFPWLVLIQQSSEYFDLSIPSEGKVIKLALPKRNRGWFHSSSKGAKHKLPSLIAIPSFVGFVKKDKTPRHGEADYFVQKIALSSSDISECTVAAMFSSMELGLCRPGEKRWTIRNYKIDQPLDILFSSSGKLYALVINHKIENENGSVIARTIRLRDGYQVELKLVYDKEEEWQRFNVDPRYQRFSIGVYFKNRHESYLIESTTHNKVVLIHQMKDSIIFVRTAAAFSVYEVWEMKYCSLQNKVLLCVLLLTMKLLDCQLNERKRCLLLRRREN
ncbi:hypothetical protein C1H46_026579 [Malus baccata]|uniref:peptidylprolyl isomerase n=1 Tax=Malus baccata TaxID=106549 RepID=A0A540LN12_MALBA|nr:hypothetical protein C1H46_026579 [Malus baccata]